MSAFEDCENLVSVSLPASFENSERNIFNNTLYFKNKLAILAKLEADKKQKALEQNIFRKYNSLSRMTKTIAAGYYHSVAVKNDGTVISTKFVRPNTVTSTIYKWQCHVSEWMDIVAVSAGESHTVGLNVNGTVISVGDNERGQRNVSDWSNIIAVAAGDNHTVGLKFDGTVVAVGDNIFGQCDISNWTDIAAISASFSYTVGLKYDGRVVVTGYHDYRRAVSEWSDITAVSAGRNHIVGLCSDGTIRAVGSNDHGECNIEGWTDIVAICAGWDYTVGLKSDGTVVAVGENDYGQCSVSSWCDIVQISCRYGHTIGLKKDGTVIATGDSFYGRCDVDDFKNVDWALNVRTVQEYQAWRAYKADYFRQIVENKQKASELRSQYRSQERCQYCGGEFKGLLCKKCSKCGKFKDY